MNKVLVRLFGKTPEQLQKNIERAMNVAALIAAQGELTPDVAKNLHGEFWGVSDDKKTYELYPRMNDHKAFVRSQDTQSITVEFYYRYDDSDRKHNHVISEAVVLALGEPFATIVESV